MIDCVDSVFTNGGCERGAVTAIEFSKGTRIDELFVDVVTDIREDHVPGAVSFPQGRCQFRAQLSETTGDEDAFHMSLYPPSVLVCRTIVEYIKRLFSCQTFHDILSNSKSK